MSLRTSHGEKDKVTEADITPLHSEWMRLSDSGRIDQAVELCQTQVAQPKDYYLSSVFLGYAFYQLTNYIEAKVYLEAALKLSPNDYYANYFYGLLLKELNCPVSALQCFSKCLTLRPEQAGELYQHGFPLSLSLGQNRAVGEFYSVISDLPPGLLSDFELLKIQFLNRDFIALQSTLASNENLKLAYVSSVKHYCDRSLGTYTFLGKKEPIRFVQPPEGLQNPSTEVEVESVEPYVAELYEVTIQSGSSLVHGLNQWALNDTLADPDYGRFVDLIYDKSVVCQSPSHLVVQMPARRNFLDVGIMLCGLASDHFGHWFAEFLPKLRLFERHSEYLSIPLIIDSGMPKSHYEFLSLLSGNRVYMLEQGESLKVQKLLVAPTISFCPTELFTDHQVPRQHQGNWSASGLKFVRDRVISAIVPKAIPSRRFFLSRKNSSWRVLVNEEEVMMALAKFGFEPVFLEDLSFVEQVRIFQNAESVVGPNGSAWNSLIFASNSVNAIILGQEDHFNWGGWLGPMQDLGYHPIFLSGQIAESIANRKHASYRIDVKKVLETFQAMIAR